MVEAGLELLLSAEKKRKVVIINKQFMKRTNMDNISRVFFDLYIYLYH